MFKEFTPILGIDKSMHARFEERRDRHASPEVLKRKGKCTWEITFTAYCPMLFSSSDLQEDGVMTGSDRLIGLFLDALKPSSQTLHS